jgi:hypothetical protein
MAELPFKGRRPTTKYKPSRLRQEVNVESTNDEGISEALSAQLPDSQIVVPETQCEHLEDSEPANEHSLSPRSAALLNRNTIKKKIESPSPSDSAFNMLKNPFGMNERSSTLDPPTGFCFEQPKAAKKLSQNIGALKVQPTLESSSMQQSEAGRKYQSPFSRSRLIAHQVILIPASFPSICQPRLQLHFLRPV